MLGWLAGSGRGENLDGAGEFPKVEYRIARFLLTT